MASPISFLKVLFYILRVSPMLVSFIDHKGFFRRVRVDVSLWRWHNRMLTVKGVLEVLQSCKLAKPTFWPIGMNSNPLLIDKILHNHIPSFKGKLFQPHFNLVAICLSNRRNAFFFVLINNNNKILFLHSMEHLCPSLSFSEDGSRCMTSAALDQSLCHDHWKKICY